MTRSRAEQPSATVVIPTFDRLANLQLVVAELERQRRELTTAVEVIVVDDGSSDGTWEWLRRRGARSDLVAMRQENRGPAVARNRGALSARGEVVLFLGDDTVPQPGWLMHHLEAHRLAGNPDLSAVVGYTAFPAAADSPFLRFINEFGAQFGYLLITASLEVPFNFFYTSNISLSRRLFCGLEGFREDFPAAAWEDIAFAYRASQRGMRLRYEPRARVIHHHRICPRTFCRRQRTAGRSGAIFAGLHPELAHFLGVHLARRRPRLAALQVLVLERLVRVAEGLPGLLPSRVYQRLLDLPYRGGLAEGLQEAGGGGRS